MMAIYSEVERDLNQAIALQNVYPAAFLYRAKTRIELEKYAAAEGDVNMAMPLHKATQSLSSSAGVVLHANHTV